MNKEFTTYSKKDLKTSKELKEANAKYDGYHHFPDLSKNEIASIHVYCNLEHITYVRAV